MWRYILLQIRKFIFKICISFLNLLLFFSFKVPPAELEDLLRGNPEVADVAVIGIPHERFGEAPRAYIVKKPDSNLTEQDVVTFVAQNTASYKHLVGGVEFISAVPKSNSGKILRKELKAKYESESSQ